MEKDSLLKLRWILILEAVFAGAYISLTRGLFVIYLTSIGYGVEGISLVVLVSAATSLLIGIFLYRQPSFIVRRVKLKLVSFHTLERIMWLLIPMTTNSIVISALYSAYMIFSSFISTFIAFIIYGSLTEYSIRDVTAKRSAANGISSILGFALGTFLLAFLPPEDKFTYIFPLGSFLGLISTFLILFLNLTHLEGASFPRVTEQPEKVFSASSFFLVLLASGNLMGIVWIPYVMNVLNGPDFLAASMSLAGTLSSIVASLFWRKKAFKTLRVGLALNTFGPALVLAASWPTLHVAINAYTSFTYTGANFLGTFLFAKYNKWLGAVKSSVLLVILGNLAQLIAAPLGILTKENYILVFATIMIIKFLAVILAFATIPEVAVVPEDVARTYSQVLYNNSLTGYRVAIEISRETILTTLRLLAFSLIAVTLYLIYRVLWILIS
ncbi:MAG: hypothetical protein QXR63_07320 [Candidatus Bathyarchaeia archaeon]